MADEVPAQPLTREDYRAIARILQDVHQRRAARLKAEQQHADQPKRKARATAGDAR